MATFVEELLVRLGLDTDEQSFKKGEKGIDDLAGAAVKAGTLIAGAFTAVQGAITAMVVDFAAGADETNKLARRIGTTAEVIQEFDYVAERSGVSVDLMRGSLEKLNGKASQAAAGSAEMADTFAELGISAEQFAAASPDEKFDQIAAAMAGLPTDADRTRVAMKLFEEEGRSMVTVFEGGAEGIAKMRQEARDLGLFSTEDAKNAEEFNDRMLDVKRAFGGIKNVVGAALVPELTKLMEGFVEFFKENREAISGGLVAFFKAAAVALNGLVIAMGLFAAFKVGSMMMAAAQGVAMLGTAIKGVRIAALLMNAAVLMIPIAIGLGIAAIALISEDLYTFLTGGESQIGKLVAQFPLLGTAIEAVSAIVYALVGYATEVFNILWSIVTLDFNGLTQAFSRLGDHIIDVFTRAGQAIYDVLPSWLTGGISAGIDGVSNLASAGSQMLDKAMNYDIGYAPFMPPAAVSNVSNSSAPQDNRVYNITGTDIGEVKRVINENNAFSAKTIDTGREY